MICLPSGLGTIILGLETHSLNLLMHSPSNIFFASIYSFCIFSSLLPLSFIDLTFILFILFLSSSVLPPSPLRRNIFFTPVSFTFSYAFHYSSFPCFPYRILFVHRIVSLPQIQTITEASSCCVISY